MPCGKRPLVKRWDRPKNIKVVKPSRYQQNEASVRVYWANVIRDLELSYKDDKFWETQAHIVRTLVGPVIFERIAKIFNLSIEASAYQPPSETATPQPSELYYNVAARKEAPTDVHQEYSISDFEPSVEEEEEEQQGSEIESTWTEPSDEEPTSDVSFKKSSKSGSLKKSTTSKLYSRSKGFSKLFSESKQSKSRSQYMMNKSYSSKTIDKSKESFDEGTYSGRTDDDLDVHPMSTRHPHVHKRSANPHFDMLYCNESETDMIKWNSKYKQKTFEISASDEFSKKAELLTKQIAHEFYEWWTALGSVDFKSEIKRPEDIEDLFQVWFDEHASRGIKFDPKVLPCVLPAIAYAVGVPQASCPHLLKTEIASDIYAETSPAHVMAFGTALPIKMKHIPPRNNTKEIWHCLKIPQDLKTMAFVWDEIQHLTSTKSFYEWLVERPHLIMPACFLGDAKEKKQPFEMPSDMVLGKSMHQFSTVDLALPVSQFDLEIKEVLNKLLD